MAIPSLALAELGMQSASDVHHVFKKLGYKVDAPDPFEGSDLDAFEFDRAERSIVDRAYIVSRLGNHTVYLYEVGDLRQASLRGLAWNALNRQGTALLTLTRDYREVVFVDPRLVGRAAKSNVRVNKLGIITSNPTRHDLDTLNAIHAHNRTGQQVYDSQAEAFNVASVTKKFYDEYREQYTHALSVIQQYNRGVREFQNEADASKLHAFTQRLMGRLMFLYFLQRKGWLGGRNRFLTDKYLELSRMNAGELSNEQESFYYYRELLEPLFFDTMNKKRLDDATTWGVRIPYLNGGLFDGSRDPQGPIVLPDSLFDPNSDQGLLAFFNRYNFTIADNTPLEQDVAVDPEMLGKVFENMLEERDRGQSGSFYTPRAIVSYMCQEALVGYLEESADIPRETTRAQFDPDAELRLTPEQAERLNAALDTLTVLDPAVGSGSFPVGMMQEIIRLRKAAYFVLNNGEVAPAATVADWKEAIIRDTLYGVDIKPEAIEIAQLRLWLALVVDQTLDQARPLPNLDYKMMSGNSLIETIDGEPVLGASAQAMLGADVQPTQTKLGLFAADSERFKLDTLRRQFFHSTGKERDHLRIELKAQERRIVEVSLREKAEHLTQTIMQYGKLSAQANGQLKPTDRKKLTAVTEKLDRITAMQEDMVKPNYALPFFLYHLHFSDVFERKGGFDIVVANPPYVRGELLGDLKDELKLTPIYADVYAGSADLYVYFYARGYSLLKPCGQLSYITSNKYLRATYGEGLRSFLASKMQLAAILDFGDLPLFDAAAYPCIVLGQKSSANENQVRTLAVKSVDLIEELAHDSQLPFTTISQVRLGSAMWLISDSGTTNLIEKLLVCETLDTYVEGQIYRGLSTGFNQAFVIDKEIYSSLVNDDPKSASAIHKTIRGRDIKRWSIQDPELWIIYVPWDFDIEAFPAIKKHLIQFQEELSRRPECQQGRFPWYAMSRYSAGSAAKFEQAKIVYQKFQVKPAFVMDQQGYYPNDAVWVLAAEDYFLLGCLNSRMGWYEISRNCTHVQNGFQLIWDYFKNIRIPNPPTELHEQIAALARRCLDAAQSAPESLSALEAELNALVYQAYGLDADDIAVIEGYLSGKSGGVAEVDTSDILN